ncbi:serine/threonine-protein phosphatase [Patescibacteria group bacterium]|nr:serine/threonine-protein phosphatase [Patescibacteria group bacterium]
MYRTTEIPKNSELIIKEYDSKSIANANHPERNEDDHLEYPERRLFGVFDGVGGFKGGEVASKTAKSAALETFGNMDSFLKNPSLNECFLFAKKATQWMNNRVLEKKEQDPSLVRMATTSSIAKIINTSDHGEVMLMVNVGDSRIYSYREGRIPPLELHTLDDGVVKAGYGVGFEALSMQNKLDNYTGNPYDETLENLYKRANKISNALGTVGAYPNIFAMKINKGDKIIITSDGVHDNLTKREISDILHKNKRPGRIAISLVNGALRTTGRRRKNDDITAVVFEVN